jgi:hypothetical protein
VRRQICLIARCRPRDLGMAFSAWSLTKLAEYLAATGVAAVSRESTRQICALAGSAGRPPRPGRPRSARNSSPRCAACRTCTTRPPAAGQAPGALRATYRRADGVRHMIAALDLATGQITYRIRACKRWREFLAFLKLLRQRWPGQELYLVMDNFSPHMHPKSPAGPPATSSWCSCRPSRPG